MSDTHSVSHTQTTTKKSWLDAITIYFDKRVLVMLAFGFSAGLPLMLIYSSLSLWLDEAGVDLEVVTMFGWAALGFSFKFVWAPLVDKVPIPIFTKLLGRRRSWLLLAQGLVILAIVLIANTNPVTIKAQQIMAMAAVLLGFSAATQDIVIDALRIEIADISMQSALSAIYTTGYRLGMIIGGWSALRLADYFGSTAESYSYAAWHKTYLIMALWMGIGIITTLIIKEPKVNSKIAVVIDENKPSDYVRLVLLFIISIVAMVITFKQLGTWLPETDSPLFSFLGASARLLSSLAVAVITGTLLTKIGLVDQKTAFSIWIEPIKNFFDRYGKKALLLLALIGLYRISDIVAGNISNIFYSHMGFTKSEIADAVKFFGVGMVILGGFIGGVIAERVKIMHAMMIGAVLASATNLLFILLTYHPGDLSYMYFAVTLDNLAAGLATTIFIAFLSALTSIKFTAVQYAIFSSMMTLFPKILSGYSGAIVASTDYATFFTFTFLIGIPILWLIYLVDKKIIIGENDDTGEPPVLSKE